MSQADYSTMDDKLQQPASANRRDSRKRRRLSERRRVFSRLGLINYDCSGDAEPAGNSNRAAGNSGSSSSNSNSNSNNRKSDEHRRSDSPTLVGGDSGKISMKIQFHITVAPDDEPLILDTCHLLTGASAASTCGGLASTAMTALATATAASSSPSSYRRQSTEQSLGEHLSERLALSRHGGSRSSRRNQLLALHNQPAARNDSGAVDREQSTGQGNDVQAQCTHSTGDLSMTADSAAKCGECRKGSLTAASAATGGGGGGRETGARSSTISGGMADESTIRFLENRLEQQRRHHHPVIRPSNLVRSSTTVSAASGSSPALQQAAFAATGTATGTAASTPTSASGSPINQQREQIYFKRDGQRFGHEFTLKLAVDRTYRCLLKLRPLIPLQSISIQGHQVTFVDCSQGGGLSASTPCASPRSSHSNTHSFINFASDPTLNGTVHQQSSNNNILANRHQQHSTRTITGERRNSRQGGGSGGSGGSGNNLKIFQKDPTTAANRSASLVASSSSSLLSTTTNHSTHNNTNHHHHRSLQHAQTTTICSGPAYTLSRQLQQQLLQQQQRQQMIRNFAVAHCTSSSSHLGSQLIYMFDWPAARFEVNKNKDRTHVHTTLKFSNGQILSLPLQVKFYQAERKQHLNWGSKLHFIDFDCNINSMGQINVDKIQYY